MFYIPVIDEDAHRYKSDPSANAKQYKRAKMELRQPKTYLGRLERDIVRKIKGNPADRYLPPSTLPCITRASAAFSGTRRENL